MDTLTTLETEIESVITEFARWAGEHHPLLESAQIYSESLAAPHRPRVLPAGWQGVYCFNFRGVWLKSGKAGPNSNARWLSQHYSPKRAMSTLARSLLLYAGEGADDQRLPVGLREELQGVAEIDIGSWIKTKTSRHNILIAGGLGREGLGKLEQIAHSILKPVFEGRRYAPGNFSSSEREEA